MKRHWYSSAAQENSKVGASALKLKVGDGAEGGSSRALNNSIISALLNSSTLTFKLATAGVVGAGDDTDSIGADFDSVCVVCSVAISETVGIEAQAVVVVIVIVDDSISSSDGVLLLLSSESILSDSVSLTVS